MNDDIRLDCSDMEDGKPEPTDATQSIRRQYNMAMNNTKLIIDEDIRQLRITDIKFQYGELLRLCGIIDRLIDELAKINSWYCNQRKERQKLQAKLKAKDKLIEKQGNDIEILTSTLMEKDDELKVKNEALRKYSWLVLFWHS